MKVTIFQPTVPHYRVPLFNALYACPDLELRVISAKQGHALPDAGHVAGLPYLDDSHQWIQLPPNHALLWQRGLDTVPLGDPGSVVAVCGNLRYLSNLPLLARARRRGVGIVWWSHGAGLRRSRFAEMLRWYVMQWVDAVLLYTDSEVEDYVARGFPRQHLFATNNTIDVAEIDRMRKLFDNDDLAAFRASKNLDRPFFLYCGRLKQSARLDLALDALRILDQEARTSDLVVIGDGPERTAWQKLAEDYGVAHRVHWIGAEYDQQRLAPWFLAATGFVYPGPIGLSLIHAMAYGLPVITHDDRANHKPEIAVLQDGVNGMMYEEESSIDLAHKMGRLMDGSCQRAIMSGNAISSVALDHSIDNMRKNFCNAVEYASQRALCRTGS
ncbi:MAG: glycosyltransferase family 4 protein [Anaerolineae bacterium]|nr:glycosyltransferase family 4 protein [Anaerolineae bacterium]